MNKKVISFTSIFIILILSTHIYAVEPSQDILVFIDEWNQNDNTLHSDEELSQKMLLKIDDLKQINDSPEIYSIDFFTDLGIYNDLYYD